MCFPRLAKFLKSVKTALCFVMLTLVGSYFIKGFFVRITTEESLYGLLCMEFLTPDIQILVYACILAVIQTVVLFVWGTEKHVRFCLVAMMLPLVILISAYLFKYVYLYYTLETLPSDSLISTGVITRRILLSREFWTFDYVYVLFVLSAICLTVLLVFTFGLDLVYLGLFDLLLFLVLVVAVGCFVDVIITLYIHNHTLTEWFIYYAAIDLHILLYGTLVIAFVFVVWGGIASVRRHSHIRLGAFIQDQIDIWKTQTDNWQAKSTTQSNTDPV